MLGGGGGVGEWRRRVGKKCWQMIRTHVFKHIPEAGKKKRGWSKRAAAGGTAEKSRDVKVMNWEGGQRRRPNQLLPKRGSSTF